VSKRSVTFTYANGFLLLTLVFVPFPTSLFGEHLFTDHSAPAAILYDRTLALQAVAWILLCTAAVKNKLTKNESSKILMLRDRQFASFALALYSLCAIIAFWFPLLIGVITIITWIFWLVYGLSFRRPEID